MINIQYMLTLTVHTSGLFLFQPSCNFTDSFQTCLNSHVLSCAKILEDKKKKKKKAFFWLSRLRIWDCHCSGSGHCCGKGLVLAQALPQAAENKEKQTNKKQRHCPQVAGVPHHTHRCTRVDDTCEVVSSLKDI